MHLFAGYTRQLRKRHKRIRPVQSRVPRESHGSPVLQYGLCHDPLRRGHCDHVQILQICRKLDAVARRKECVEALNEIAVLLEEYGDTFYYAWDVNPDEKSDQLHESIGAHSEDKARDGGARSSNGAR